jgi:hypothetical protein
LPQIFFLIKKKSPLVFSAFKYELKFEPTTLGFPKSQFIFQHSTLTELPEYLNSIPNVSFCFCSPYTYILLMSYESQKDAVEILSLMTFQTDIAQGNDQVC